MNSQERIQKYIQEHCKNCKNKNKFECEIRVFQNGETIYTRCTVYEREDKKRLTKVSLNKISKHLQRYKKSVQHFHYLFQL